MASFVTNPRKRITELLSEYLEFDAKDQLSMKIWSGHVKLTNVSIRERDHWIQGGTIGDLNLEIPWQKRLVWGSGDVQVKLQNVVLILRADDLLPPERELYTPPPSKDPPPLGRHETQRKRRRIAEAEKRLLEGRPIAPWLLSLRKRDQERRRKEEAVRARAAKRAKIEKGSSWVMNTVNEFLWKFASGLQLKLNNLKVVVVLSGIEVGLTIPSISVSGDGIEVSNVHTEAPSPGVESSGSASSHLEDEEDAAAEQIRKRMKIEKVGMYVRRQPQTFYASETIWVPLEVARHELIIRPVNVDFRFCFYLPQSKEKQRHRRSKTTLSLATVNESEPIIKQRRGKRDRKPMDPSIETEAPSALTVPPPLSSPGRLSSTADSPTRRRNSSRRRDSRRLSWRPSELDSADPPAIPRPERITPHSSSVTLPLAEQLDYESDVEAVRSKARSGDIPTGHIDISIGVSLIDCVLSNRHYALICDFLTEGFRKRNHRPSKSIKSVLEYGQSLRRSMTVMTPASGERNGPIENIRMELHSARNERGLVISSWWKYANRIVLKQLRNRKVIQDALQDRYFSFSWSKQRYRRSEYVKLFVLRLKQQETLVDVSLQEQLDDIEADLTIEQILLYRSLSRTVHVQNLVEMPSILQIHEHYRTSNLRNDLQRLPERRQRRPNETPHQVLDQLNKFYRVCRQRAKDDTSSIVAEYPNFAGWFDFVRGNIASGETVGSTLDDNSVSSSLDVPTDDIPNAFLCSFKLHLTGASLSLVEESVVGGVFFSPSNENESQHSQMTIVSRLTDDVRMSHTFDATGINTGESSPSSSLSGSERLLLSLELKPVSTSILVQNSEFSSVQMTVGSVRLKDEKDFCFVSSGSSVDDPLSQSFFELSKSRRSHSSSVSEKQEVVQIDFGKLDVVCDSDLLESVKQFAGQSSVKVVGPVLNEYPHERESLFLLKNRNTALDVYSNVSFRCHGCRVRLPTSNISGGTESSVLSCDLSVDLVEIYSGLPSLALISDASEVDTSTISRTRQLSLLDVEELQGHGVSRSSWLVALSDVDIEATTTDYSISLLRSPVQTEALIFKQSSFDDDFSSPGSQSIVRTSEALFSVPLDLSGSLLDLLEFYGQGRPSPSCHSQRLDALARYVRVAVDIECPRAEIALLIQTQGVSTNVRQIIAAFIRTVGQFDLQFPNESTLSSAMQICIDRLTVHGISAEDSWRVANAALLSFLEESESTRTKREDAVTDAVSLAVELFDEVTNGVEATIQEDEQAVVVCFPDGFLVSSIALFYDSHTVMKTNSLLVSDTDGVHLLRLFDRIGGLECSEDSVGPDGASTTNSTRSDLPGLSLHMFDTMEGFDFGSGGMSLFALAGYVSDEEISKPKNRVFSYDAVIGNAEVVICPFRVKQLQSSLELVPFSSDSEQGNSVTRWLMSVESLSVLATSDDLSPLSRAVCEGSTLRVDHKLEISARMNRVSLSDLSPEGRFYPDVVKNVSSGADMISESPGLTIRYAAMSAMPIQVRISCCQLVFTQRFALEMSLFLSSLVDTQEAKTTGQSYFSAIASQCSFVLPRSSYSSDLLALEVDEATVVSLESDLVISLPTTERPLDFELNHWIDSDGLVHLRNPDSSVFQCLEICLKGAKMYTALSGSTPEPEICTASFRYYFEMTGRAKADKSVYKSKPYQPVVSEEALFRSQDELRAASKWKVLCEETSFDIVYETTTDDSTTRMFISDLKSTKESGFHLSLRKRDLACLLSVWYENMNELPSMFSVPLMQMVKSTDGPDHTLQMPDSVPEVEELLSGKRARVQSLVFVGLQSLSISVLPDLALDGVEGAHNLMCTLEEPVLLYESDTRDVQRMSLTSLGLKVEEHGWQLCATDLPLHQWAWPDVTFGLQSTEIPFVEGLPQRFQFTSILWRELSFYSLGIDSAALKLEDLAPVWHLLEFGTSYFADSKYGNPMFAVAEKVAELENELECSSPHSDGRSDFQLWLTRPTILFGKLSSEAPTKLLVEGSGGLWYHSSSLKGLHQQEFVCSDISVKLVDNLKRDLVNNFSLAHRMDYIMETKHTDHATQIPAVSLKCGLLSKRLFLKPFVLQRPTICTPAKSVSRSLQDKVCEVTALVDCVPKLQNIVCPFFPTSESMLEEPYTMSFAGVASGLRIFVLDPHLGSYLPLLAISLQNMHLCVSNFKPSVSPGSSEGLQAYLSTSIWADYFKLGATRTWEPLLEPYRCSVRGELSHLRGAGVSFVSEVPFQANITTAFLSTFTYVYSEWKSLMSGSNATPRAKGDKANGDIFKIRESPHPNVSVFHDLSVAEDSQHHLAFSFKNLTGVDLRVAVSRTTTTNVAYVEHGESVALDYPASVTILENLAPKEVEFPGVSSSNKELNTHKLDIQVPGFQWIRGVQVDTFGRGFTELIPVESKLHTKQSNIWQTSHLFQLLIEIGLEGGGRQVSAKSVFSIQNATNLSVSVLLSPDYATDVPHIIGNCGDEVTVQPGDAFNVPVLLFLKALQRSEGFGSIWVRPQALNTSVKEETKEWGPLGAEAYYSSRPIDVLSIAQESQFLYNKFRHRDVPSYLATTGQQLSCPVTQNGERRAPFCFALEVGRSPLVRAHDADSSQPHHGPVSYELFLHPPFTIRNLLPQRGRFELMHAVHKTVVWCANVEPGAEVQIYSVGLDAPLLLLISLESFRTPIGEGALVHHGTDHEQTARDNMAGLLAIGKASKAVSRQIGRTLTSIAESPDKRGREMLQRVHRDRSAHKTRKRMLDSVVSEDDSRADGTLLRLGNSKFIAEDVADETTLVDEHDQRLTLGIDNERGGGGQRKISVFCEFWVVNSTEHSLLYRQEGQKSFIGGGQTQSSHQTRYGINGSIARLPGVCKSSTEDICDAIDSHLQFGDLSVNATMFSFSEELSLVAGHQRICIKLSCNSRDTEYISDWSDGISLDSVGISQIVNIHCKDGRFLELTVVVQVAPNPVARFTKIIRILPRYVVMSLLPYPVRLWQDSSIFQPHAQASSSNNQSTSRWAYTGDNDTRPGVNQYEALWGRTTVLEADSAESLPKTTASGTAFYVGTVAPGDVRPFTLPDSRGFRQLRIDSGFPWKLCSSFSVDVSGDHVLANVEDIDLKMLPHPSTRASSTYVVSLDSSSSLSDGEFGVWYETEWDDFRRIIVKAVKKHSFAFKYTDIHVGDELLSVDGISVYSYSFSDAIASIRSKIQKLLSADSSHEEALVLQFRTVEERMRRVRMKAMNATARHMGVPVSTSTLNANHDHGVSRNGTIQHTKENNFIRAELKTLHNMMCLVLKEEESAPFEIVNQSLAFKMQYRQKGCESFEWQTLSPGETTSFTWQEPLKPKRLCVRFTVDPMFRHLFEHSVTQRPKTDSLLRQLSSQRARSEEESHFSHVVNVRLEEIGYKSEIVWEAFDENEARIVEVEVTVSGATRILSAKDAAEYVREGAQLRSHIEGALDRLEEFRIDSTHLRQNMGTIWGTDFVRCHQLRIQVFEAKGLTTTSYIDGCNPYAEVKLKYGEKKSSSFRKRVPEGTTYFVKNSRNPEWESQVFVFDIPPEAVESPKGNGISVTLRNYRRFGKHQNLGKVHLDLNVLRNEIPLSGWFPLAGRAGRRELNRLVSHWGRGSVHLEVHWIHSETAWSENWKRVQSIKRLQLEKRLSIVDHLVDSQGKSRANKTRTDDFLDVRLKDITASSKKVFPTRSVRRDSSLEFNGARNTIERAQLSEPDKPEQLTTPAKHTSTSTSVKISSGALKNWSLLRSILLSGNLVHVLEDDHILLSRRESSSQSSTLQDNYANDLIGKQFAVPGHLPTATTEFYRLLSSSFTASRESFQLASRRTLSAVLHGGGWITVRPIQAMNLTDAYKSVFVRAHYGSQIEASETIDNRVGRVWSRPFSLSEEEAFESRSNDLNLYIAPQRTNGDIKVVVHGDRHRNKKIRTKPDLGCVDLPLKNAIAACIEGQRTRNGSFYYQMWYPLRQGAKSQQSSLSNTRLSQTSSETSDATYFLNSYESCLHLALIWTPDDAPKDTASSDSPAGQIVKTYFNADVSHISMALIDSERSKELISITFRDTDVRYWVTNAKTRAVFSIDFCQIDNQDANARERVILAPTPSNAMMPSIQFFATKDNIRSIEVTSFDFIDVFVAEFDVTLEETLLFNLFHLVSRLSLTNTLTEDMLRGGELSIASLLEVGNAPGETTTRVYVEQLYLGEMRINLSYMKGKRTSKGIREKSTWVDKRISELLQPFSTAGDSSEVLAAWSSTPAYQRQGVSIDSSYPQMLASMFPNVSDAPLRLQGKVLNHIFESPNEILSSVRRFAANEVLRQIYKIVGSLDFVGNPTMLVSSFISGFRDLVTAPSKAFIKSPRDPSRIGLGVAKGSLSFVSHSTSALFAFLAKVTATTGQTIALLSFDNNFKDWHKDRVLVDVTNINRHWKKRGVRKTRDMIVTPLNDIVVGIGGGISGMLLSPARGFQANGTCGLVKGLAIGCAGLFVRPAVGVFDALTHIFSSIHDLAKVVNLLERRFEPAVQLCLPHTFGLMNTLSPYDVVQSRANHVLETFPSKKHKREKVPAELLVHAELLSSSADETYAMVTTQRVILVRSKNNSLEESSLSLCWEVCYSADTNVMSRLFDHGHSVALTLAIARPEKLHEIKIEDQDPLEASGEKQGSFHHFQLATEHSKNDSLETYSVVAEYKFRSQLGRIHNAICCVMGNFDSVIYDESLLDHPNHSSEGFTRFGIYHFSRNDDKEIKWSLRQIPSYIEDIPWVPRIVFEEASKLQDDERTRYMLSRRTNWSYEQQLEESKRQGGPMWLIEARADAHFLHREEPPVNEPDSVTPETPPDDELVNWRSSSVTFKSPFAPMLDMSMADDDEEEEEIVFEDATSSSASSSSSEGELTLDPIPAPRPPLRELSSGTETFTSARGSLSSSMTLGTPRMPQVPEESDRLDRMEKLLERMMLLMQSQLSGPQAGGMSTDEPEESVPLGPLAIHRHQTPPTSNTNTSESVRSPPASMYQEALNLRQSLTERTRERDSLQQQAQILQETELSSEILALRQALEEITRERNALQRQVDLLQGVEPPIPTIVSSMETPTPPIGSDTELDLNLQHDALQLPSTSTDDRNQESLPPQGTYEQDEEESEGEDDDDHSAYPATAASF